MGGKILSPKEIAETVVEIGKYKSELLFYQKLFLAILGGLYIALGAHGAITISQTFGIVDVGLSKFLSAAVFPIGLMLVIICGAELFTGNNLMILGVLARKYSIKKTLMNWIVVYGGNFIGSIILAFLVTKSGLLSGAAEKKAISIAVAKTSIPLLSLILRAVLCNTLVVLAVWMATAAKDTSGKILACWFPVMLFVLSGYEHCIANMFFIPAGIFLGADISWLQMWKNNVIPVTAGNIIGGAMIVPLFYYFSYIYPSKTIKNEQKAL